MVACGSAQHADLVFVHGDVRTMDPARPHASALAVRGETIVAIDDVEKWIGKGTHVVDLAGASVTPGLVDAHCHLYGLGVDLENVNLRDAKTEQEAAAAAATGKGEWITGRGWDQNKWPTHAFPTHASIDAIDKPVLLSRIDGHAIWVNAKAMAIAGVTAATPDPPGGKIVRDSSGAPTGVFVDNAMDLVEAKLPSASRELRERRIAAAAKLAVAAGITGVHEMGIEDETVAAYRELAEKGQLPLHVTAYHAGLAKGSPPAPVGRFALVGVKFFSDGALGSRGARLYEDYSDDAGNRGLWVTEPAKLKEQVAQAVAGGWQVAIHAIGDAGIGSVLDAYLAAEKDHPGDLRLRVEHVQVIAPADVDRLVAAHAVASMQPTHATSDMPWAQARVGAQRILGAYAWRTMLDRHVPLAFGSDFPVEEVSPLLGIYAAVTRQDATGAPAGGWYPAQRMTLDEAIAGFTRGAAYAAHAENARGMIAVGRAADLTVFDRPLAADRTLLETRVQMTVVGGQIVYASDKR